MTHAQTPDEAANPAMSEPAMTTKGNAQMPQKATMKSQNEHYNHKMKDKMHKKSMKMCKCPQGECKCPQDKMNKEAKCDMSCAKKMENCDSSKKMAYKKCGMKTDKKCCKDSKMMHKKMMGRSDSPQGEKIRNGARR